MTAPQSDLIKVHPADDRIEFRPRGYSIREEVYRELRRMRRVAWMVGDQLFPSRQAAEDWIGLQQYFGRSIGEKGRLIPPPMYECREKLAQYLEALAVEVRTGGRRRRP